MIQAIVYTSNTGNTKQYAQLLGNQLNLPVYELPEAKITLEKNTGIIYMGWVMADGIQGYPKAVKHFEVSMVSAVGMSPNSDREAEMRQMNGLPEDFPLFILQGGYYPKKLKGIQKLLMMVMAKSTIKNMTAKEHLSKEEQDYLDLLKNGGSRVCLEHLKEPIHWYEAKTREMSSGEN